MALIIEDGTAISNAQAYIAAADVGTYWTNRNQPLWAMFAGPAQEAAILYATQYMEVQYYERWKGRKLSKAQALAWPRIGAYIEGYGRQIWMPGTGAMYDGFQINSNEIPQPLKDATSELALKAAQQPGIPLRPDIGAGAADVKSKRVGPLEITYGPNLTPFTIFAMVNLILEPLLGPGGHNLAIVRG